MTELLNVTKTLCFRNYKIAECKEESTTVRCHSERSEESMGLFIRSNLNRPFGFAQGDITCISGDIRIRQASDLRQAYGLRTETQAFRLGGASDDVYVIQKYING